MGLGVRTFFDTTADLVFTSNATLATTGLTSPIAASQRQSFGLWIPFTVGATGGIRLQIVVPAGGVLFDIGGVVFNTVTPAEIPFEQQASAAFTNALAVAGDHFLKIWGTIVNGVTAGNIDVQMAQNTVDVLSLTVKRGAFMNVVTNN
jgi:hypothetical protein